ncbi:ABC transporter permease [Spirochaetota bacterium]
MLNKYTDGIKSRKNLEFAAKELFKKNGILIIFVILSILVSVLTPNFLSRTNVLNILRQSSIVGIMAIGTTFVIIGGGFDISVGSILALSAAICMGIQRDLGWHWSLAILASLSVGALVGLVSGILAAKIHIVPIIVTLGMMYIIRGVVYLYTGGYPINASQPGFDYIGGGYIGDLPVPVVIFGILVLVWQFVLSKTPLGRYTSAIGGNKDAARLCGVKVDFYHIMTFVIGGIMAAAAGIIYASRLSTASPLAGDGYELQAIAACVIGGTSVSGGEGSVVGTLIGILILTMINNMFSLLGAPVFYQKIITGAIILAVVGIDSYSKKKAR